MNGVIIDVQGFVVEKSQFLPKELAVYDGQKLAHYVFQPPYNLEFLPIEFQRQAKWLMENFHGLDWNCGFVPSHQCNNILIQVSKDVNVVYVKGREKANFLRKIISQQDVVELSETPSLPSTSQPKCFVHSKNKNKVYKCALTNVYFLYETFFKVNSSSKEEEEEIICNFC